MMRGLGQNPSEEELQELIDSVDEGEKDGQIQLREFIKLYTMSLDNKNATSNTEVNDCFATFGGDPRDKASKITSAAVRVDDNTDSPLHNPVHTDAQSAPRASA